MRFLAHCVRGKDDRLCGLPSNHPPRPWRRPTTSSPSARVSSLRSRFGRPRSMDRLPGIFSIFRPPVANRGEAAFLSLYEQGKSEAEPLPKRFRSPIEATCPFQSREGLPSSRGLPRDSGMSPFPFSERYRIVPFSSFFPIFPTDRGGHFEQILHAEAQDR
jgi:hypothetical protein